MAAEKLDFMKDKAENSSGRVKDKLTQAYKSYADYAFPEKEIFIHFAKMKQILLFVHKLLMNVNNPIVNVSCKSVLSVVLLLSQE